MQVLIRPEESGDREVISSLITAAFGRQDESKLVNLLRCSVSYIPELSLVAVIGGNRIVGHVLFTKNEIVNSEDRKFPSLSLAPIAVLPDFQKQGIGGKLIRHGLETAKQLGYESVIVLGHQDYYPRFGFQPSVKWNIRTHYEVPSEAFMALELFPGSLSKVSGIVEYPKEFGMI